jgi:predicted amidophosphoribosyltransferase
VARPQWIDIGVRTLVLFPFSGPVRRTIIDWKEEQRRAAGERVVEWLALGLAPLLRAAPDALVVPVPSSRASDRSRGARVLVEALRTVLPADRLSTALLSIRARRDQAGLNREQRSRNVHDAMRWEGSLERPLIIVDDIVTSGATLRESARAVRSVSEAPVCAFALASRGSQDPVAHPGAGLC